MKMAPQHFKKENTNTYRGYFPFLEGDPSHKEFFDMPRPLSDISEWEREGCALYQDAPWSAGEEHKWILDTFRAHFERMHRLSLLVISCMSIGLGKSAHYFDPWFKDECSSTFRAIHYKPREGKFEEQ
jgi:isopenicillin N synthase-like dioxygenase